VSAAASEAWGRLPAQVNAPHLEEGLHRFSQFFIRQRRRQRRPCVVIGFVLVSGRLLF
jgi:hypothetical protein